MNNLISSQAACWHTGVFIGHGPLRAALRSSSGMPVRSMRLMTTGSAVASDRASNAVPKDPEPIFFICKAGGNDTSLLVKTKEVQNCAGSSTKGAGELQPSSWGQSAGEGQ